ncbi:hypothetical protein CERSUDRAFT_91732 [Gelatoporia subvermispora B]|uniref:Uncharacterized protein n=1 Tax=Ceriporiopsis subvermispora (strain B) TaxID=914234 RepID=M2R9A1_CERS8|nr:hypothetical protein CERSUDRAFT_91732 [Gelatoporia subvermispora B]
MIDDIPCPFIASILAYAWNIELYAPPGWLIFYGAWPGSIRPASWLSWAGDNDSGITVLDVTDPTCPAFGFLQSKHAILTPLQYLRIYDDDVPSDQWLCDLSKQQVSKADHSNEYKFERVVWESIVFLKNVRMIDMQMLAEAWPKEYGEHLQSKDMGSTLPVLEEPCKVPSLFDIALERVVTFASEYGDAPDLEKLVWYPERVNSLLRLLRKYKPFPLPYPILSLLAKTIEDAQDRKSLDLSGAIGLSAVQISQLLPILQNLRTIDLSFNPFATVDVVRQLLAGVPTLRRLVVMGCPNVESDVLCTLVRSESTLFRRIEALMHPLFLDPDEPHHFLTGFTFIASDVHHVHSASVSLFTPVCIVDGLIRIIEAFLQQKCFFFFYEKGCIAAQAAFSSMVPQDGEWDCRVITSVASRVKNRPCEPSTRWAFAYEYYPTEFPSYEDHHSRWAFIRLRKESENSRVDVPVSARHYAATGEIPQPHGAIDTCPPTAFDIFDVRGFIRAMEEEDRELPTEEDIEYLESLLSTLEAPEDETPGEANSKDKDKDQDKDQDAQPSTMLTAERVRVLLGTDGLGRH